MLTVNKSISKYLNQKGFEEEDDDINIILYKSIYHNKVKKFKHVLKFVGKNNIVLDINKVQADRNENTDPLTLITKREYNEIAKLLLDYATQNNIILKMNNKDEEGMNPLFYCLSGNNNFEMLILLINYAT